MSTPFLGEIKIVPYNFAPRSHAFCNGQILPIAQNTALFSLLGTTYGGNGQTTFALPDLRGRIPMHPGQGPGLTDRALGEVDGTENETLQLTQIPAHSHVPICDTVGDNSEESPAGHIWGADLDGSFKNYSSTAPTVNMAATLVAQMGGGQPHSNQMPTLVLNFIIAVQGIFPARN